MNRRAIPQLAESPSAHKTLTFSDSGHGLRVDLDRLVRTRALFQANSGGGKSHALRQLLEETHGRVQQLVIDPEGEFSSLRERFDYVLAAVRGGDVQASPRTAAVLCRRLVELGASAVLDIYDLPVSERREFVRRFVGELMALPRSLWRPLLVVLDEAHHFAPEKGHGESVSTQAVIDLCTLGRKRGFAAVLATQRISKLHKDAAAELLNKFIGRTGLDLDMKRAGDDLGLDKEGRGALSKLEPGEFFAFGPAISATVERVRTGNVLTSHPEAGQVSVAPPPPPARVKAMLQQLADLPQQAEEEESTIAGLRSQVAALKAELAKKPPPAVVPAPERVEVSVFKPSDIEALKASFEVTRGDFERAGSALSGLRVVLEEFGRTARKVPSASPKYQHTLVNAVAAERRLAKLGADLHTEVVTTFGVSPLTRPQQRILNALASFERLGIRASRRGNVAVFSDQSPRSSGYANNLSRLKTLGLVIYPTGDQVALTEAGRALAQAEPTIGEGELHIAWEAKLPRPQWLIVKALVAKYPSALDRDALAVSAGQSPTSSGYANNLSALRSLGLIEYQPGKEVVATDLLFPSGGVL